MPRKAQEQLKVVARSARQCWDEFVCIGGLDVEHYDGAVVAALAKCLNLDPTQNIGPQLDHQSVTTEDFIDAFFAATATFTDMLSDLLAFFEKADASYSSTGGLSVAFDFGSKVRDIKFDLKQFREWEWRWEEGKRYSVEGVPAWNHDILRGLAGPQPRPEAASKPLSEAAERWLVEYDEGRWPADLPNQPAFGSGHSGHTLRLLWNLWSQIVQASRDVGDLRSALDTFKWTPTGSLRSIGFDPWLLKLLDAEAWSARVLRSIFDAANDIARQEQFVRSVQSVFDSVPKVKRPIVDRVAVLEELLSLPAWKRRSELYSAWVGCQIVQSLGPHVEIHSIDGWIRYSFGGTHLATARRTDGDLLYVWAELRSPLENPKGKGRTRAIQPDYSIQKAPITYPESSVLVVECKQYLKASSANFTAALEDYARGRPRAKVVLVNHGQASDSIRERLSPHLRDRTEIIGDLNPSSDVAQNSLRQIVRSLLGSFERPVSAADAGNQNDVAVSALSERTGAPSHLVDTAGSAASTWGRIILRWSTQPRDLDLHVWLTDENGAVAEISYENSGTLASSPWATLYQDCREGSGPEIVAIGQPRGVRCAVFNYSCEKPLAESGAILEITLGTIRMSLHCPSEGRGRWWVGFEYRTNSSDVVVYDRIGQSPNF
ncbi:hypothetical protein ACM41_18315 [Bradyrhizobium sp. CCBAU 21362]|uniref:hypothetical protein n=1 Tax=Bradyrhizobium sp. CCBAU 21362 TaxID=1325082 RepID=UPI002306D048|nr:hypothetical protein [Bradyrhizobium sp. CCBAU 21362]MDA9538077.1 hypothetical protein [Bradyrhizobium sp. CCBAU 21362]